MNIIHKVKQSCLLFIPISIVVAAFSCDDNNPGDLNGNKTEITWQQTALDSLAVRSLAANSKGDVFAAIPGAGIFLSADSGDSWRLVRTPSHAFPFAINTKDDIFAADGFKLIRSTDNGESWVSLDFSSAPLLLRPIAFNSSGEIFVGSIRSDETIGGIYHSNDNGDTWMQTGFPDTIGVNVLAVNSNGDIFAGTGFGVYRSSDNGETWAQINTGFKGLGGNPIVEALAINPINGDIFAAILVDGLYCSTNNGDNWELTTLTDPTIRSIVFNSDGDIFAGSGGFTFEPEGVFFSTDNGKSWTQINNGLTNLNVLTLTVDPAGFVFAGTRGSGVFRSLKSTTQ